MPQILERLVSQLQAKGMPKSKAFAVATAGLQKAGDLEKGSQKLTRKGMIRQSMGAAGRAKDRAAKASGHKKSEYSYNAKTNRATLK
jgi:hypothetical protein